MLSKLLANFEPPAATEKPVADKPVEAVVAVVEQQACAKCGGSHQWKTRHGDEWYCVTCRPPAVPALVFEMRGGPTSGTRIEAVIRQELQAVAPTAGRISYTTPKDRCTGCRGALFTETTRSDGSWDVTCWVCGKRKEGSDG